MYQYFFSILLRRPSNSYRMSLIVLDYGSTLTFYTPESLKYSWPCLGSWSRVNNAIKSLQSEPTPSFSSKIISVWAFWKIEVRTLSSWSTHPANALVVSIDEKVEAPTWLSFPREPNSHRTLLKRTMLIKFKWKSGQSLERSKRQQKGQLKDDLISISQ